MKNQASECSGRMQRKQSRLGRLISGLRVFGLPLILAASAMGAFGCVATVGAEGEYEVADDVPPDMTVYPHTVYEGRDVYLVNDRYYYRGPQNQWVYYRHVPPPLHERRATFVRERPPVVRERPYVQQAPTVVHRRVEPRRYEHDRRRVEPGVRSPVPATQVR